MNDVSSQFSARIALQNHSNLLSLLDELRQHESSLNPSLPQRNDKSWVDFFSWINEQINYGRDDTTVVSQLDVSLGIVTIDEEIRSPNANKVNSLPIKSETQSTGNQECSLSAKVNFRKGDAILNIDRRCMLTNETALKDDDLGDFIRNDSIASAMQNVVLVLHLLNEHCKGEKSFWYPYLSILPNRLLPVLSFDQNQWKQLLPSAHIFDALKMVRSISRQYSYFFKRLQSTNLPLRKVLTFHYYCWGVSIVCSRQNEIPPSDRQSYLSPLVNALIPVLDMCNHDHSSNQAVFEANHSVLYAPKNIEKGNEIKINYGARTSGEFYIHNGFVPELVPYDMVPINLTISSQDPLCAKRIKLLKILNMPSFGRFKLVPNMNKMRHRRDPHLTMFLIVYLLSEKDIDMILESDNAVGCADELYEHVQYSEHMTSGSTSNNKEQDNQTDLHNVHENHNKMTLLGQKLSKLIREYSSKRATIGVAIINRALEESQVDKPLAKLLEHERDIYQTYII